MEFPVLPLFPPGALAGSVTVTVWVGVMIVAITNLRLGWVLSGLVVPGYMVPLLIAKPVSAAVVFAEGFLTYALVWFYSEYLTRYTGWSNFFGRDRFFALVLASVGVRLVNDGWLLPQLGAWLESRYTLPFDYRNDLHSFGLIVVSLIANNFWKTGFVRGALPMAVQLGATWLLVRLVLMPLTNFNIESTAVLYEDIATSMLASPKAYVILVTTAFIASRLNLFYGWDFSGILIPSLLALQWFEPYKIVATLAEAMVVLVLSSLALRLPVFRSITVEGARKIMLFFSVSFAYKFALGWLLALWQPDIRATDWYGFGYLLATLIAIKIHDKNILERLTQATLQTSLAGVALATPIGFALLLWPDARPLPAQPLQGEPGPPAVLEMTLREALLRQKTSYYLTQLGQPVARPDGAELDAFAHGVRLLLDYRARPDDALLQQAQRALAGAHYEVLRTADEQLLLREREPGRHWGSYAISLRGTSRLLVEVPAPLDEALSFESGVWLHERLRAGGFASAGSFRPPARDRATDVLQSPLTIFQVFHREMAAEDVLQVRSVAATSPTLHLSGGLPAGVDLNELRSLAGGQLAVEYTPSSERNLQRDTTAGRFAELWLERGAVQRVEVLAGQAPPLQRELLTQPLSAEVLRLMSLEQLAAPGSEAYRRPRVEELLRLDTEVLSPMAAVALHATSTRLQGAQALAAVQGAAASAASLGLRLRWVADAGGEHFLLDDPQGHRGLVAVHVGPVRELVVEVPRPLEERGTLEVGVSTQADLGARGLLVAGAARDANADRSADVLDPANPQTLFQLAHQVLLREMADRPGAALQVRNLALRPDQPPPAADAVLALDVLPVDRAQLGGVAAGLLDALRRGGMDVQLAASDPQTAGYGPVGGPQAAYMNQTQAKRFAVLWLSPLARAGLPAEVLAQRRLAFDALSIPVRQADIAAELSGRRMAAAPLPTPLREAALRFRASGDIVALAALQRAAPALRLERIEDLGGRGAFLLLSQDGSGELQAVLSLAGVGDTDAVLRVPPGPLSPQEARAFVTQRRHWLEVAS